MVKFPWRRRKRADEPILACCAFCGDGGCMDGSRFCCALCAHLWSMNGHRPGRECQLCGRRGCDSDFFPMTSVCKTCIVVEEEMWECVACGAVLPSSVSKQGVKRVVWHSCGKGYRKFVPVSDEEFEAYRNKILNSSMFLDAPIPTSNVLGDHGEL